MWLRCLLVTALLIGSVPDAAAQTPMFRLAWESTDAATLTSGYQWTVTVDAAAPVRLNATCSGKGAGSTCVAPAPTLTSGTHTLIVTAFNGFGSSSSDPLVGSPPGKPINVTVTVTITIP